VLGTVDADVDGGELYGIALPRVVRLTCENVEPGHHDPHAASGGDWHGLVGISEAPVPRASRAGQWAMAHAVGTREGDTQ
jgi:hypothetical protein